jgi:hypothetical protein
MKKLLAIAALVSIFAAAACSKDDDPDPAECDGVTPTYTADVKAILDTNCAVSGCHNAVTQADGKNLSTYAGAKVVSQLDEFLGAINHEAGYVPMPNGGAKLSDATIKTLTCWVENGSPE